MLECFLKNVGFFLIIVLDIYLGELWNFCYNNKNKYYFCVLLNLLCLLLLLSYLFLYIFKIEPTHSTLPRKEAWILNLLVLVNGEGSCKSKSPFSLMFGFVIVQFSFRLLSILNRAREVGGKCRKCPTRVLCTTCILCRLFVSFIQEMPDSRLVYYEAICFFHIHFLLVKGLKLNFYNVKRNPLISLATISDISF